MYFSTTSRGIQQSSLCHGCKLETGHKRMHSSCFPTWEAIHICPLSSQLTLLALQWLPHWGICWATCTQLTAVSWVKLWLVVEWVVILQWLPNWVSHWSSCTLMTSWSCMASWCHRVALGTKKSPWYATKQQKITFAWDPGSVSNLESLLIQPYTPSVK